MSSLFTSRISVGGPRPLTEPPSVQRLGILPRVFWWTSTVSTITPSRSRPCWLTVCSGSWPSLVGLVSLPSWALSRYCTVSFTVNTKGNPYALYPFPSLPSAQSGRQVNNKLLCYIPPWWLPCSRFIATVWMIECRLKNTYVTFLVLRQQ